MTTCPPDCVVCWLTRDVETPGFAAALHERAAAKPHDLEESLVAYGSGWLNGFLAGVKTAIKRWKIGLRK